jgi:pimeloyl-ACP methyl ester carboxylesterase
MRLKAREWGAGNGEPILCVHGLTQHGGIFEPLAQRLVQDGARVVSLDLRGHGESGHDPPWTTETHVDDLLETADALGVERATWIGHSFGGRMIAAVAERAPERVDRLVLLDPGLEVPADYALKSAEMDRLDWSFSSVDGAVNALLSSDSVVAAPREVVTAYVANELRPGPDGRLRFGYCPSTVVTAWSELVRPAPSVAPMPTLIVRPVTSAIHNRADDRRYRDALGSQLTMAVVPHGHNVLWEAPSETEGAIVDFLAKTRSEQPAPAGG